MVEQKAPARPRVEADVRRQPDEEGLAQRRRLLARRPGRIAVRLVITPFLLTTLGDTVFGIWQVLRKLIDQTTPASGRPGRP